MLLILFVTWYPANNRFRCSRLACAIDTSVSRPYLNSLRLLSSHKKPSDHSNTSLIADSYSDPNPLVFRTW